MEGVNITKSAFTGLSSPATKWPFLASQAQASRRLQYPVVQTSVCVIVSLHNEATSRMQREQSKREFCNNHLIMLT